MRAVALVKLMERDEYASTDRSLERALLFNFLVHALAMASMAAFLLPCLPGGGGLSDLTRVANIARHPWLFRAGWFPWQLCAVADLMLAVAMVRTRWIPRAGAVVTLLLTMVAVVPDQLAQTLWVTRGVELARTDAARYLDFEREIFPLTAGWGALFYTLAALGWTLCFARAGTWSRTLTVLSIPLWTTMFVAVIAPLLPPSHRPSATFVSGANALGFVQLQVWLGLVTDRVLRRHRPDEAHGRLAVWRHPSSALLARMFEIVANSRLLGALLEPLPELAVRSDITEVVYVNYLVPAERLQGLVPQGLELQRLGPEGRYALFTFLTFRHGHFGFAMLGPLRRLMPSPVQTNWRIHVRDPRTRHSGIYFVTNAITSAALALGARMITEGMPMHVLDRGEGTRGPEGVVRVVLDPGRGSAPDCDATLRPTETPALEGAWRECWDDYRAFLAYCVPQDRAMSSQPLRGRVSRHEINLAIPIEACEPLEGTVVSRAARAIVGEAEALCFRVPGVTFRFSVEAHDRMTPS